MGVAIAALGNFESERWDADVHGAIALASTLAGLVKRQSAVIKLSMQIRKLNHLLSDFLSQVHKAIERGEGEGEEVKPERVQEAEQSLMKLHDTVKNLYRACKHVGLTNNSLIGGQLHSMANYADEIHEIADLLRMSLTPEVIESIYERAQRERENGDVYELSQVE